MNDITKDIEYVLADEATLRGICDRLAKEIFEH